MIRFFCLSILLNIFAISYSQSTNIEEPYTPEFYETLPFEGMKGNVESVISQEWSSTIENGDTIYRSKLFMKIHRNYTKVGLVDNEVFEPSDIGTITLKHFYKKNKIVCTDQCVENEDGKEEVRFTLERENKNRTIYHAKGIMNGNQVDKPYLVIEYNYEDQFTTTKTVFYDITTKTMTYYQNHLKQKEVIKEANAINTYTYDKDGNLQSMCSEAINGITPPYNSVYRYLKYDQKGNWTERLRIGDGGLLHFEERKIKYRE